MSIQMCPIEIPQSVWYDGFENVPRIHSWENP